MDEWVREKSRNKYGLWYTENPHLIKKSAEIYETMFAPEKKVII